MNVRKRYNFVLAFYPNSRGVAFVVFEGPLAPVDWGVRGTHNKRGRAPTVAAIAALFELYQPAVLVLQDMSLAGTRRTQRIRDLNAAIGDLADDRGLPVRSFSRAQVREAFAPFGAVSKEAIADVIAKHIPAFARQVPPPRKPWKSEHSRMGLFDAAALALTFFHDQAAGSGEA